MSPKPKPGAVGAAVTQQFIAQQSRAGNSLREALQDLSENPSDPRITRAAYKAIVATVISQLAQKADRDVARSIAQDTAHRVLVAAAQGKPLQVAFVRTCARNLFTHHVESVTRKKRDNTGYQPETLVAWNQPLEHTEVVEKLAELPRDVGRVLALRFLDDQTLQQTADSMGLSVSKVHRLEKSGLSQMRELLAA